jgi:hypothetical protein
VLGGADALPEQPHPILLLRANYLGFRAKGDCLLARRPSLSIVVMGDEAMSAWGLRCPRYGEKIWADLQQVCFLCHQQTSRKPDKSEAALGRLLL